MPTSEPTETAVAPEPTPTTETPTPTPTPTPTEEATPSPSPSVDDVVEDDAGGTPAWVWWLIGLLVVGAAVGVPLIVRARRRAA